MTAEEERLYPMGAALEFLQRLWGVNHALEMLSSAMMRTMGVTVQQRFMLRCLGKYPGLSAGNLAALLHVDPGTVSASLGRMERKRLIERRRDPRDQRRAALGLTQAGRALDQDTPGTAERAVERWLTTVDPQVLQEIVRQLERLTQMLVEESKKNDQTQ